MKWSGEWHPLAERYPMLTEDALRELADDIKANGQHDPCVMTPKGLGIDGRNRTSRCPIAGS